MDTKVQFNPSTLKASYNPSTGKVQTITSICDYCVDFSPLAIQLTFSGVTQCCNQDTVGSSYYWNVPGLANALNGVHILPLVSACRWLKNIKVNTYLTLCQNSTCIVLCSHKQAIPDMWIEVKITNNNIRIVVYTNYILGAFLANITIDSSNDLCRELTGIANNELVCPPPGDPLNGFCSGGTCSYDFT